jgi:uncharacterized membrane protein YedE/YeeE
MRSVFAFIAGLVFGLGLILSGMTNPAKVLGFLDLAGAWDPSLALVMAGAILIGSIAFGLVAGRRQTLLGDVMHLPTASRIDRRLVLGSLTFGVGWGLGGYCPGPALTSLLQGGSKPLVFVLAMIAGMMLYELLERIRSTSPGNA